MISSLHLLLTYNCTCACDHCFVFSRPRAPGVFTLGQIRALLAQARQVEGITGIYFEGGEPGLYYATLREGVREAKRLGFSVGIVSNGYWAISDEDAEAWLRGLQEVGLTSIDISDDDLHFTASLPSPAKRALVVAERLGLASSALRRRKPVAEAASCEETPRIGVGIKYRGRAVEKLAPGLPLTPWERFTACPYEDLRHPSRVHIDPYGNVNLCQGLLMGNVWETPLADLIANYQPDTHPICAPLLAGGPAALARAFAVAHEDGYVDACHLCYLTRRALRGRFPRELGPGQVYGECSDRVQA